MAGLSLVFLTILLFVFYRVYVSVASKKKLPPGSRPLPGPTNFPLVGRVHDVPAEATWLKFYEWSKVYGPIYQMEIFGSVHVWISTEQVAHDLLSRRSVIYSDRPVIPNLPDNRTSGNYLALLGRTETWKRQRKLCHHLMTSSANQSLHAYPTIERDRFLYLLGKNPAEYLEYIEQFTSRTVSRLSWGSPHPARTLRKTTFGLLQTISPSGALPNVISWLMHLPEFLSPWKQKEHARHAVEAKLFSGNVAFVKEQMEKGTANPSFVGTFLGEGLGSEKAKWGDIGEATYVVGLMAIAGALTIGSPIQSFLLAMCHYPEWQRKLQQEIDEQCEGRCPRWGDREKLPLLRAVVKEVIRWRPPVPTGIPHCLEKDDVYNGYFIPAGATIHALEWGITRDESLYPDPEVFNPGRWVSPKYPTTYKEPLTQFPNLNGYSQFGFGRRTCQGVPIVEQDLFLTMGGIAWAFNIQKKRNADGTEVPVHWNDYTPLLIAKPAKFQFDAVLRSEERGKMLEKMYEAAKGDGDEEEDMDVVIGSEQEGRKAAPPSKTNEKVYHEIEKDIPGCPGRWSTESDVDSSNEKGLVESESDTESDRSGSSTPLLD